MRDWATGAEWIARVGAESGYEYDRPLLAHFLYCPFCTGFWISLAAYFAYLAWPTATLYAATPLAISAVVGLVAKNLDA